MIQQLVGLRHETPAWVVLGQDKYMAVTVAGETVMPVFLDEASAGLVALAHTPPDWDFTVLTGTLGGFVKAAQDTHMPFVVVRSVEGKEFSYDIYKVVPEMRAGIFYFGGAR